MKTSNQTQILEVCTNYINDMSVSLEDLAAHLDMDNEKLKKKMIRYSIISLRVLERTKLFNRLSFEEYFYNNVSLLKIANDQETIMKIYIEKRIIEFLFCIQEKDKEKAQTIFTAIADRKEFTIIKMAKYKYEHQGCSIEDFKKAYYNFNDNDIYNLAVKIQEMFKDYFINKLSSVEQKQDDGQMHYWHGAVRTYNYIKIS